MTFGERLKQSRNRKQMTQEQVAQKIGIDFTTISKYENDRSQPDNEVLQKLAQLYGVSIDWLLVGSLNEPGDKKKINRLIINGEPEELTTDEAGHLKDSLEMYRLLKEKRSKEAKN
ncbi:helix-turn-helix domain-containing protein [Paenibacillus oleatilyticus]|nr:helix-turn-helix transcriptional regulator [Paenibacillus oleatilyticus]MBU7318209.1 helix-turn-helix domain-containing protein [Paenibacillus oleatilyticus]